MNKILGFLIAFILLMVVLIVIFVLTRAMVIQSTENVLKLILPFLNY